MDGVTRGDPNEAAASHRLPFLTIENVFPGSIIAEHVQDSDPSKILFLAEITHDAPDDVVVQLVNCDAVHKANADSVKGLRQYRLGGPKCDKTCLTIMDGNGLLYTAIYVQKAYTPIKQPGQLLGNVRAILETPTSANAQKPLSYIFYSVTSMAIVNKELPKINRIGSRQITEAFAHLNEVSPDAVKSTLSPCRLESDLEKIGIDPDSIRADAEKIARHVTDYLRTARNPVQRIHMPLGGWPVAIRTGSGDRSIVDGREIPHLAMVNYLYPSDPAELRENIDRFFRGDYSAITPVLAPA